MISFPLIVIRIAGRNITAWCIIPTVFLLAVFLPPLLLACILILLPTVAARVVSILAGRYRLDFPFSDPVAVRLRSPPAC
jgi:hypothetical protein